VHLINLTSRAGTAPSPSILATQLVLGGSEVTALAFGPGFSPQGSPESSLPLLAVAGRRGAVKVLRVHPEGSCTIVASLSDHKAAICGVAFTSLPASGVAGAPCSAGLATADRDGKRLLYRWDAAAGQLQIAATAAAARHGLVAMAPVVEGQVLVAANKAGRACTWEAGTGRETGSVQLLDRSRGEHAGPGGRLSWAACHSANCS